MTYLMQFLVILGFSFAGEILHALVPLPIPASVYGLLLLLGALCTGKLKAERVRGAAKFLLDIMPVLFVPSLVGLLDAWPVIRPVVVPALVVAVVSTLVVMAVTGRTAQAMLRRKGAPRRG